MNIYLCRIFQLNMLLVVMADYFATFLKSDTIVGVEVESSSETKAGLDDCDTRPHQVFRKSI